MEKGKISSQTDPDQVDVVGRVFFHEIVDSGIFVLIHDRHVKSSLVVKIRKQCGHVEIFLAQGIFVIYIVDGSLIRGSRLFY